MRATLHLHPLSRRCIGWPVGPSIPPRVPARMVLFRLAKPPCPYLYPLALAQQGGGRNRVSNGPPSCPLRGPTQLSRATCPALDGCRRVEAPPLPMPLAPTVATVAAAAAERAPAPPAPRTRLVPAAPGPPVWVTAALLPVTPHSLASLWKPAGILCVSSQSSRLQPNITAAQQDPGNWARNLSRMQANFVSSTNGLSAHKRAVAAAGSPAPRPAPGDPPPLPFPFPLGSLSFRLPLSSWILAAW